MPKRNETKQIKRQTHNIIEKQQQQQQKQRKKYEANESEEEKERFDVRVNEMENMYKHTNVWPNVHGPECDGWA